jgi:hypothetical protein
MPIRRLLKGNPFFGPDDIKVLVAVFEDVLATLGLTDRNDPATEAVAKRIITLAGQGSRDSIFLREAVLKSFRDETQDAGNLGQQGTRASSGLKQGVSALSSCAD